MVFQRKSGAMTKVQQTQVQQKKPVKTENKFEEDSDEDEDDEDVSDGEDNVGAESDEQVKSGSDDDDDIEDDDDVDDDDDEEEEEKGFSKNSKAMLAKGNQKKPNLTGKQEQQKGNLLKMGAPANQKSILNTSAKKNQMPESGQNKRKSTDSEEPSSKRQKLTFLAEDEVAIEEKRQKERDKRSLFVAQIPVNVTENDVRALSDDIVDVRIPIKRRAQQMQPYAFVEFVNEAKAEENYSKFGNMKLGGQKFVVDFVGEKSKNQQRSKPDNVQKKTVNKFKLFVSGIPTDCQLADVSKLFPTSNSITLEPHKEGPKRFAYVTFSDEDAAKTVFKKSDNLKLNGRPLTVLYAAEHGKKKLKNKKKSKPRIIYPSPGLLAGKKQKQQKVVEKPVKKEEASDDDDDDEDDDDADDSDDE